MGIDTISNSNVSSLKKYKNPISEFENYLKDIYCNNNSSNSSHKGYLINLKDYETITQSIKNINFDNMKENDFKQIFEINQIEFKTSHYLINMILNGNKYIFINTKLWKLLCDKDKNNKNNDSHIMYKVNTNDITFSLLDNTTLSFKHNNNIIDENSYKDNYYRSNYKQITNIYNSITYYFNFENKILKDLKNGQSSKDTSYAFLISKNWIDKWKEISYYENIKTHYLQKNLNNKNEIINCLIYYFEKNNINYSKLFESINILKFNKKEDFESYLRNDSLILIEPIFFSCFNNVNNDNSGKKTQYNVFNNNINIYLDNNEKLSFKSNNNIISLNENININNSIHLKQLIKIFFFQKKIKSFVKENYINSIYLINKNVINYYKTIFNYKKLYEILKTNSNTKNINNENLDSYYNQIINELDDNYISQFINREKTILKEFKYINDNFIELEYKIKYPSEKYLKYIINFEIVGKDIKDFFIKNSIVNEELFKPLNYCITESGKILIVFGKNNNNFYEIGYFNDKEDFIIEYLIDELESTNKNYIINYCANYGLNYFIKYYNKDSPNLINLDYPTKKICYYYKIEEKSIPIENKSYQTQFGKSIINVDNNIGNNVDNNIVNNFANNQNKNVNNNIGNNMGNNNDIIDNKFVKDIIIILFSIFIFERNLLNCLKNQSNKIINNDLILLSNQFLIDFKNLFSYDKIYSILEKINISVNYDIKEDFKKFTKVEESKNILRLIFNKEKEFEKNKDKYKNTLIFKKKPLPINLQQNLIYPDEFCILNENVYSKLNQLLNINLGSIEEIQFKLSFNQGRIALKPKSFSKFNYILICSCLNKEPRKDIINYIPNIILSFYNFEKMNNSFDIMVQYENIFEICSNNNLYFENKYKCKIYLINHNNIIGPNKTGNIELDKNNNKVNKYLSYLIIIHKEYSKIKKDINETVIIHSNRPEEEYYLINREYLNELENILHFKEFIKKININDIQKLNLDINNINNDIMNKIKDRLNKEMVNYLITLDENQLLINTENKYYISKIELQDNEYNNKLHYYKNCQIINKKLYLLLSQIDKNILLKTKQIRCVLNNKKIIIFNKNNIINTGYLNEDNTFIIEYIIYSRSSREISIIFEVFKKEGYAFIQAYLPNKRININVNNVLLEAKIYSLLEEKETKRNLSSKLKTLILLSLFNQKNYKPNNMEKVFLINKDWLFQYQCDEINKLIEKNEKLKNYLYKENTSNLSIDSIQIDNIIPLFDYNSLLKIDYNISKLKNISYQARTDKLKLYNKDIVIYTKFVMINEKIAKMFEKNFDSFKCEYNTYLSHRDGDIIIISIHSKQHSILFGNIYYKEYSFNIKFIFDFEHSNILKNELDYLMKNEIKEYIEKKTLFNEKNESDTISPIFDNDNEIGYCFKYNSNMQYLNYNNFYDYKNSNLLKAIKIYFYYRIFSNKVKETKSDEKDYYLINSIIMSEIKINYKYKQIKEELDNINFMDNNNKKIMAIKSLSNDTIKYFKENNKIKNKYKIANTEPDIIPINDNKTGKQYLIYDKFEILERDMVQKLINEIYRSYGINSTENNYLRCELNEGKVIIHYPKNFNDNNKYISVIGQLNYENHFLNEYILIYNDSSSKSNHINHIKGNLNKYLKSLELQFIENSAPITDKNYKEIGIIIKYSNETSNYNSNNLRMNTNENTNDLINNYIKGNSNSKTQYFPIKKGNDINQNTFYNNSNNNEDEYNLDYQANTPEIRDNFPFPPKIGLQNIGATCYMNATLQCFCHIGKFVNFFKYSKHVISKVRDNKNNLTSSFKLLIEKLWPNNYDESYSQKYYAPEEFKNKISKMNPLFEGIAANDAKDLVNFIIMTLHQELNKAEKSNINKNNIIVDQRNQQIMFNNFAQNFKLENQSIISDLFYGINCNITQCCNCSTNIYNYQIYFFLVFPLEEVRKFKNNNFLNNSVNIYDCFDYDRKVNLMYGENSMYCAYCKQNTNCNMCTCLTIGPEILILLLNRGHGIEFNVKINFMEDLDLSNYIQLNNTGVKYKLIGVITHIGESGMGGHFIAYCKDPISQSWTKYNDAIVSDVQEHDFQREVINFAMPYLLFYQKSS